MHVCSTFANNFLNKTKHPEGVDFGTWCCLHPLLLFARRCSVRLLRSLRLGLDTPSLRINNFLRESTLAVADDRCTWCCVCFACQADLRQNIDGGKTTQHTHTDTHAHTHTHKRFRHCCHRRRHVVIENLNPPPLREGWQKKNKI